MYATESSAIKKKKLNIGFMILIENREMFLLFQVNEGESVILNNRKAADGCIKEH